jgi:hypothetical protein
MTNGSTLTAIFEARKRRNVVKHASSDRTAVLAGIQAILLTPMLPVYEAVGLCEFCP